MFSLCRIGTFSRFTASDTRLSEFAMTGYEDESMLSVLMSH